MKSGNKRIGNNKINDKLPKNFVKDILNSTDIQQYFSQKNKENKQKNKYMLYISNEVRKPFDSINLQELKQQMIQEAKTNKTTIYNQYDILVGKEIENILYNSLDKGYNSLLGNIDNITTTNGQKQLQQLLLSTGNRPILYESTDMLMGKNGQNLIGKILMQIRHILRNKINNQKINKEEQKKYNNIYNIYIAYLILTKEINENNDTLKKYIKLNPSQIISKFGINNIQEGIPSEKNIIKLYKNDKLNNIIMSEIFSPGSLVLNVRKYNLKQLQMKLKRKRDDIIVHNYLEYMINRNIEKFPKYEEEKLKILKLNQKLSISEKQKLLLDHTLNQQFSNLSDKTQEDYKSRIVDLFNLGMLSSSLSNKIDKEIDNLNIPSDEDITNAELAETVPYTITNKDDKKEVKSNMSDNSSSDNFLKKLFKPDEKQTKKDLITLIVQTNGGNTEMYKDKTKDQLQNILNNKDTKDDIKIAENINYKLISGEPVIIYHEVKKNNELAPFSPESIIDGLLIDSKKYKSIQIYILTRLLASTGIKRNVIRNDDIDNIKFDKGMGLDKAYDITVNLDLPDIMKEYDRIKFETENMLLSLYTNTSLNKKFEDSTYKNLLLLTNDKLIYWEDNFNLFLGAGDELTPGNNYVGKVMMEIRERLQLNSDEHPINITEENMMTIMLKDSYITDWITIRVHDMCKTVFKLTNYIHKRYGYNTPIDETQINFILDNIYNSCNLLKSSDVEDTTVPFFIINIVNKCQGMTTETFTKTDNNGIVSWSKEISKEIKNKQENISKLNTEFWEHRAKHTLSESLEFNKKQREEWAISREEIINNSLDFAAVTDDLNNLKKKQKEDYDEFWEIDNNKKTKDEILLHEQHIKLLNSELNNYESNLKKKIEYNYNFILTPSELYWKHIVIILTALYKNLYNINSDVKLKTIRETILNAGIITSDPKSCIKIISNKEDNCIVSALLNLLSNIHSFLQEFASKNGEYISLDEEDVKLAGSIIMNTNFESNILFNDDLVDEMEKEMEMEMEMEMENDEGLFPEDDKDDDDEDDDDDDDEDEDDEDNVSTSKFSFAKIKKSLDNELDKIEHHVRLFTKHNVNNISKEIINTTKIIKEYNMSNKIKLNRINFFSTNK
jgi:predicted NAD-dependent protein-ADP-ribosyltransferase YbiA (DUF1768 family)